MKNIKKISVCIVTIAVLVISGYNLNVSMNSTTDALSAMAILNLDALANGEASVGGSESDDGLTIGYTSKMIAHITFSGWPGSYLNSFIRCCRPTSNMGGCDFSMQDHRCS
jgi:hypothetical protein